MFSFFQEGAPVEAEGEGYFVPPNKGTSQAQVKFISKSSHSITLSNILFSDVIAY